MSLATFRISGLPEFHTERLSTIFVHEGQTKPKMYDNEKFFAVSKLEMPKEKSLHFLDYSERQFFHSYEPEPDPKNP